MRKFFTSTFQVTPVFGLDSILDGTRDRVIDAEDGALDKLDFSGGISLQTVGSRHLSLSPSLGRA